MAPSPIKPFTAEAVAGIWKVSLPEAQKVLETLAGRAMVQVLDYERATEVIKTSRGRGISTCIAGTRPCTSGRPATPRCRSA